MSLPCRGGKPRGGAAAGPARGPASGWMSPAGMQQGDHSGRPACGRRRGTAIGTPVPSRQISWPSRTFYELAGRPGPDAMAGHSMPSVNRWPDAIASVLPDCRSGLASRVARPGSGPLRAARPGFLAAPRAATPSAREPTTAAILVSSPASCRGRHHERVSVQATAMFGKYSLDHVGQWGLGSAEPLFCRTGDSCRPATFWRGCASVCWRSCYPILLAPKVCVSTVVQLLNLEEGTAPCRDPDGSANSSQCWAPTGPPKPNRAGRD